MSMVISDWWFCPFGSSFVAIMRCAIEGGDYLIERWKKSFDAWKREIPFYSIRVGINYTYKLKNANKSQKNGKG